MPIARRRFPAVPLSCGRLHPARWCRSDYSKMRQFKGELRALLRKSQIVQNLAGTGRPAGGVPALQAEPSCTRRNAAMQHWRYSRSENGLFSSLSKRCTSSHGARHSVGSLLLPEPIKFKTPSLLLPARGLSVSSGARRALSVHVVLPEPLSTFGRRALSEETRGCGRKARVSAPL